MSSARAGQVASGVKLVGLAAASSTAGTHHHFVGCSTVGEILSRPHLNQNKSPARTECLHHAGPSLCAVAAAHPPDTVLNCKYPHVSGWCICTCHWGDHTQLYPGWSGGSLTYRCCCSDHVTFQCTREKLMRHLSPGQSAPHSRDRLAEGLQQHNCC
jgi:hypothetical protein